MASESGSGNSTPMLKRRKTNSSKAAQVLQELCEDTIYEQNEAMIEEICKDLRSDPGKILKVRAFLKSDIVTFKGDKLKRGTSHLHDIPLKFLKVILPAVIGCNQSDFCNMPMESTTLKELLLWCCGKDKSYKLPEREMEIEAVINMCKEFYIEEGSLLDDLSLTEGPDWNFKQGVYCMVHDDNENVTMLKCRDDLVFAPMPFNTVISPGDLDKWQIKKNYCMADAVLSNKAQGLAVQLAKHFEEHGVNSPEAVATGSTPSPPAGRASRLGQMPKAAPKARPATPTGAAAPAAEGEEAEAGEAGEAVEATPGDAEVASAGEGGPTPPPGDGGAGDDEVPPPPPDA